MPFKASFMVLNGRWTGQANSHVTWLFQQMNLFDSSPPFFPPSLLPCFEICLKIQVKCLVNNSRVESVGSGFGSVWFRVSGFFVSLSFVFVFHGEVCLGFLNEAPAKWFLPFGFPFWFVCIVYVQPPPPLPLPPPLVHLLSFHLTIEFISAILIESIIHDLCILSGVDLFRSCLLHQRLICAD